ncbi:MAG TPA: hypothetical protein VLE96_05645 [Chlamydiales bacterium]|nr:hypothetical protein [Chlamydiales bacterium]
MSLSTESVLELSPILCEKYEEKEDTLFVEDGRASNISARVLKSLSPSLSAARLCSLKETASPVCLLKYEETNFPALNAIVLVWEKLARYKQDDSETVEELRQFEVFSSVCHDIIKKLNFDNCSSCQFYLCTDFRNNPQAVMILKDHEPQSIELVYILTNPNNLRSAVNEKESNRVTGAGSFLLCCAEAIARAKKKVFVKLSSLASAIDFYKMNGYTQIGDSSYMQKSVAF